MPGSIKNNPLRLYAAVLKIRTYRFTRLQVKGRQAGDHLCQYQLIGFLESAFAVFKKFVLRLQHL